ncbi:MAG: YckD family protein [Clostridiales bacterium]|jgi:Spy/CpxP family protein refolding chaperone|nr:YckD family protein [Clostridiales bacterium]
MNKKLLTGIAAVALIGALGTTALAATTDITSGAARPFKVKMFGGDFENLTEEEKAELETELAAKRTEMEKMAAEQEAKWEALSDSQKEELYALQEAAIDNQIDMIEKQLEFGLIDETQANEQITRLEEAKTNIGGSGDQMFFGGHGGMKFKFSDKTALETIKSEVTES